MSDQQPDFRPGEPSGYGQPPYSSPSPFQAQPQGYGEPTAPQYGHPQQGFSEPRAQQPNGPQGYGMQQPSGQQQPGYGVQPYPQPYGYQSVEHPQSQMVFILGILGIFTGVTAFVAWYMGGQARKEIQAGAPYQWGGQLKTGYTLGKVFGILSLVAFSLVLVFYVVYFIFIFRMLGGI